MNTKKSTVNNGPLKVRWMKAGTGKGPTLAEQLEQLPEYIEFRTALIKTLDAHPAAKEAVIQRLRERGLKDGPEVSA